MQIEQVKRIKKKYEKDWLEQPEVVGVGIGLTVTGDPGIIVSVTEITEAIRLKIAPEVDKIPVEFKLTGKIKAL